MVMYEFQKSFTRRVQKEGKRQAGLGIEMKERIIKG
jgi:hypothetical protein